MAKKAESTLLNMVLVLTIIAVVSAVLMAIINNRTKGPIADLKVAKTEAAVKEVLPPEIGDVKPVKDSVKIKFDGDKDMSTVYCYIVKDDNDELIGVAVESSTEKGFSGHLGVMVGFDAEGNITGYNVLETQETPGLGSKAGEWFQKDGNGCVIGMNPATNNMTVKKDGGEVDAITAATISSRAFCDAINRAYKVFTKVKGGTNNE